MSFMDLFEEMEKEMEQIRNRFNENAGFRQPLCDVRETNDKVIIDLELPGVRKGDIDISVTEDDIEIKTEARKGKEKKEKDYYRMERSYKGFYRRFILPAKVKPEKAKADYKNGLLTVAIPKLEAKKPKKEKIKVKVE